MTIVKVCGMTRPEDIEAANRLRPDMVGFVFHRPSRRCVTREGAMELGSMLDPSIRRVGVFVDEDPLVISELVGCGAIDTVQLHGVESSSMQGWGPGGRSTGRFWRGWRGTTSCPEGSIPTTSPRLWTGTARSAWT